MSTRAAAATWTLRAKQHLIRLLFASEQTPSSLAIRMSARGHDASRAGVSNNRQLQPEIDHSKYSYSDLRVAYLERIQMLHPDKQKSNQQSSSLALTAPTGSQNQSIPDKKEVAPNKSSSDFIELLNAWSQYDAVAKDCKRLGKTENSNDGNEANFTMFGVGCSFSDTDDERELRTRIMDQASRGWFSIGELSDISGSTTVEDTVSSTATTTSTAITPHQHVPLSCDAMFQATRILDCNDRAPMPTSRSRQNERNVVTSNLKGGKCGNRSSLVSHLIPPHRR